MHIYSEKTDGLSGTAKIRFGFSVALLLLMTASTGVRAEAQTTNVETVSASAAGTPQTGTAQPQTSSTTAPGTASATGTAPSTATVPGPQTATAATAPAVAPAGPALPAAPASAAKPPVIQDFSPVALYHHADQIVKAVILILIFASVLSWSIWSGKTLELLLRGRRMRKNLAQLAGKHSLYQCGELSTPSCEQMRQVALGELNHAQGRLTSQAVQALRDRVLARIQRVEAAEARRATRGASILATTSAVAPFIGLFGTVWGIMHSFISIAQSQTTNLSVVAPGIAEALFATALGLVVAIPAVILYNVIGRLITGYRLILAEAMTLTLCLLSHDLDALEQDAHPILTSAA